MELNLINGKFTAKEANQLLTKLVRVKTDFHLQKIDLENHHEEDIKQSEKRIKELEDQLRNALAAIRESGNDKVTLRAKIELEGID